jgi:hypothetical protein
MHFYPTERIALFIDGANTYATKLWRRGSTRVDRRFLGARTRYLDLAFSEFVRLCRDLPEDPFCIAGNRFRRRDRLLAILDDDGVVRTLERLRAGPDPAPIEAVSRWLPSDVVNDERAEPLRAVAPLTDAQLDSFFLGYAIGKCLQAIGWAEQEPCAQVDVDIVRCEPLPNLPAAASPQALAVEWRPFTMAVLISREGVDGGGTLITAPVVAPPGLIEKDDFTLKRPWTGWIVDHRRAAHSMAPVQLAPGHDKGHHTMLWIGLSRLTPEKAR